MNHALSSALRGIVLAFPLLAACASEAGPDPSEATQASPIVGGGATCTSVGGSCVALGPASCASGHWADATKASCGGGLGVGCCLPTGAAPVTPGPAPSTAPPPAPGPAPSTAPSPDAAPGPVPAPAPAPAPGPVPGPVPAPAPAPAPAANACVAAGGSCVGLSPVSCPSGAWADAATHSCGGGVGVGCCLP